MTLTEFAAKEKKSEKTVVDWLNKGYVPGAVRLESTKEWNIPENARPPYMRKKPTRGGVPMFKSMARAVSGGFAVFPRLYDMPEERFEAYIQQLISAEIITSYVVDDITYYEATLKTEEFLKMPDGRIKNLMYHFMEGCGKALVQELVNSVR